jgi:hypothetical protein
MTPGFLCDLFSASQRLRLCRPACFSINLSNVRVVKAIAKMFCAPFPKAIVNYHPHRPRTF